MRAQALACTTLLFALAAGNGGAQEFRTLGDPLLGRAKEASGVSSLVRDAALPDAAVPNAATPDAATPDAATPDAVVPGRAKGFQPTATQRPDIDMLRLMVGGAKDNSKQKDKDKDKDKQKDKIKEKPQPPQPPAQPAERDIFASAAPVGSEAPEGLNPNMIGDLPGFFSLQRILIPVTQGSVTTTSIETDRGILTQVTSVKQMQTLVSIVAHIPLAFAGPIKIAENQSPMPQDRVFLTYNYYNGIQGPSGPSTLNSQSTAVFPNVTTVNTPVPGGPPSIDLHRQTFGFEKMFLDGSASVGMRMPFQQVQGDGSIGQQDIGDISGIFNYAFFRNTVTGSGLAGGLMLTAPTGPPNYTVVGNIHPWLFQPFVGYRWFSDRLYVQGFSSVLTPTDSRYVTAMFNDVAAGYWLYRGNRAQTIWAIIPTVEAHVTTPFNHRNLNDPIAMPNFVTLTAGVHIGLTGGSMLTVGTIVPVSGPRLFPIEAAVQFNYRY